MPNELDDIGELTHIDDQLILGGEAGGPLILKRSELAELRRMADCYPINSTERREVVEHVMTALRATDNPRYIISAAQTMATLSNVNLGEMKAYLAAKSMARADGKEGKNNSGGTVNITFNVVEQLVVKTEPLADAPMPIIEQLIEKPNGRNGH